MGRSIFVYLAVLLQFTCNRVSGLHNISFLILAPNPTKKGEPDLVGNGWQAGPALYPATRLAIEHINANIDVLPDYNLQYVEADTACSATSQTATSLVRDVFQNVETNQIVGIIGPGCSEAALAVSELVDRDKLSLLHITQGNNPQLEEAERINTFASVSSALFYVESFITLMKINNWTRIATLVDVSRNYFKVTHARFRKEISHNDYEVVTSNSITVTGNFALIPLEPILEAKARVIFVFAQKPVAAILICAAYRRNMIYPNYQWIFHDRKESDFYNNVSSFILEREHMSCTEQEMRKASRGIILNLFDLEIDAEDMVLGRFNKSYNQYKKEYKKKQEEYKRETGQEKGFTSYANSYYDAVWALALAIDDASKNGLNLESYRYGQRNETELIRDALFSVVFVGFSGKICFRNETRSPRSFIDVYYLNGETSVPLGKFNDSADTAQQKLPIENHESYFISDKYSVKYNTLNQGFGAVIILLTIIISGVTIVLQWANIFWSSYHSIKATSPNINHLIFSGCYLFMIACAILTVQGTFILGNTRASSIVYSVLCNTLTWCFCLGYSLIFGTVCAKTWRVYRLFKHFQNQSPGICLGDDYLILHVMILLGLDIVICLSWNVIDPWVHTVSTDTRFRAEQFIIMRSQCVCKHSESWIPAMILYKGAVTVALVVLSILNRKVKRKNFQHTRKVNILIYGTTLIACVALPLYFLLGAQNVYIGFMLLFLVVMTTELLCLLVIFLPPVLPIVRLKLQNKDTSKLKRGFSKAFSNSLITS